MIDWQTIGVVVALVGLWLRDRHELVQELRALLRELAEHRREITEQDALIDRLRDQLRHAKDERPPNQDQGG